MNTCRSRGFRRVLDEGVDAGEVGGGRALGPDDGPIGQLLEEVGLNLQSFEDDLLEQPLVVPPGLVAGDVRQVVELQQRGRNVCVLELFEPVERPSCFCSLRLCSALLTGWPESSARSIAK